MRTTIVSIILIAIASVITISCGNSETKDKTSEAVYTCPMHPEVITTTMGKCPKCGMDLVKKETSEKTEMKSDSTMKGDSSMKM